jgi:hypothetical protein
MKLNPTLAALLLGLSLLLHALPAPAAEPAASPAPWPVVGRQGLVLMVIVPLDQVRSEAGYAAQIERLCPPERTCFVNFYSNSSGAQATVPLPEAIANEATATFRRSVKQGAESFRWACRLQMPVQACF